VGSGIVQVAVSEQAKFGTRDRSSGSVRLTKSSLSHNRIQLYSNTHLN